MPANLRVGQRMPVAGPIIQVYVQLAVPPDALIVTLFALDTLRNATPARALEPLLEGVRDLVLTGPFISSERASRDDLLIAFDQARPRLNVITSLLRDLKGSQGADISTGLGFLPPVLQRIGLSVSPTERNPRDALFLVAQNIPVSPYTIGEHAPFPQQSLDWVVLAEVLEHLKIPPARAITAVAQLLRPGGRLVLTTPNIARLSHLQALVSGETFLEQFPEDIPAGADPTDHIDHVREYSVREVVEAVEASDLAVDTVIMTGWGEAGYAPLPNPYVNEIIVVVATRYDTDIR